MILSTVELGATYTMLVQQPDGGETVTTSGTVDHILLVLIRLLTQLPMLQAILVLLLELLQSLIQLLLVVTVTGDTSVTVELRINI